MDGERRKATCFLHVALVAGIGSLVNLFVKGVFQAVFPDLGWKVLIDVMHLQLSTHCDLDSRLGAVLSCYSIYCPLQKKPPDSS